MGLIPALRLAVAGQRIRAADFNANFDAVRSTLNGTGAFLDRSSPFTAPQSFAAGAAFTGGTLDVTGATLAGFPNWARRDQANTFTGPVILGTDPGGSEVLRVGGEARVAGSLVVTGPFIDHVRGGGFDRLTGSPGVAGSGYLLTAQNAGATALRPLFLSAESVIVGSDPSGSERLRIAGALRAQGGTSVFVGTDRVVVVRGGAGANALLRFDEAAVGRFSLGYNPTNGFAVFDDNLGAFRFSIGADGTARTWGAHVLGTDPGGSEALRVGGAARVNGYLRIEGTVHSVAGTFRRPDDAGAALSLGNGTNRAFGELQIRDATGATLWGVVNAAGASFAGDVTAGGIFTGSGAGLTGLPWAALTGVPSTFAPSAHGHAWGDLSGVPASFPPSAHGHGWGEISGAPDFARRDLANSFAEPVTLAHGTTAFVVPTAFLGATGAGAPTLTEPTGVSLGSPTWRWIRCTIGSRTGYVPVLFDNTF